MFHCLNVSRDFRNRVAEVAPIRLYVNSTTTIDVWSKSQLKYNVYLTHHSNANDVKSQLVGTTVCKVK
jgi:hypothetical protein